MSNVKIRFELYPDNIYPYLIPPLRQCLTLHTACVPRVSITNTSLHMRHWTEVSDYFCFLALPVVFSFVFITQLISLVNFIKIPVRSFLETCLIGLCVASLLLLGSSCLLTAQHYLGPLHSIVITQPYAFSCRDWFSYTSLWLIVMMALERALSVSSTRASQTLCTSCQAVAVVVMIFCVGFVSAMPRFWEYEVTPVIDTRWNVSSLAATKTQSTVTAEYNSMYFWYIKSLTLFLPYTIMIIAGSTLIFRFRGTVLAKRHMAVKYSTASVASRCMKDEVSTSKLLLLLMVTYASFSTPINVLDLFSNQAPNLLHPDSRLFSALHNLFTVFFYLDYALHLIIYFCYNRQFRVTLLSICCCCC